MPRARVEKFLVGRRTATGESSGDRTHYSENAVRRTVTPVLVARSIPVSVSPWSVHTNPSDRSRRGSPLGASAGAMVRLVLGDMRWTEVIRLVNRDVIAAEKEQNQIGGAAHACYQRE